MNFSDNKREFFGQLSGSKATAESRIRVTFAKVHKGARLQLSGDETMTQYGHMPSQQLPVQPCGGHSHTGWMMVSSLAQNIAHKIFLKNLRMCVPCINTHIRLAR